MNDEIRSVVREIYKRWGSGDPKTLPLLFENLSDDVTWCSLANGCTGAEFTRERCGKAQVQSYFEEMMREWDMIHFTVEFDVLEGNNMVVVGSCGFKHKITGKPVETQKVDVIEIENGKIVGFREFYDTAKLINASQ